METREPQSFESLMTRLEEITRRLERGDIPLEESLKIFEEGTNLIQTCKKMLDTAEQKVRLLSRVDGEEVMLPFDGEQEADK